MHIETWAILGLILCGISIIGIFTNIYLGIIITSVNMVWCLGGILWEYLGKFKYE